ncbi:MAG: pyridoxal phosphate-dependent aminotransferase [Armatimonadota bacterium]|nr:MAG: pyridoxal phosphate-dependent aminotransferase [Armatimonadota bacterium]
MADRTPSRDLSRLLTRRAETMTSFLVMDILEEALALERQGEHIIHLEVGEPDFPTPACIVEAMNRAIAAGHTRYTHSMGIAELREAICERYREHYGVEVRCDQVVITSGTSPALLLALAVLVEPGDEVIISDPGYACYPNFVELLGGRCVFFPLSEADGFQYDPARVAEHITPRTKAIIVNSPANPTGVVLEESVLGELAALGPPVISDEIYHGLTYGVEAQTMLRFTDRAFVLDGFSKRYAMTGWRLGYVVAPPMSVRAIQKIQQNLFICANSFAQWAGVAAIRSADAEVERMRGTYDERRRYLVPALRELGFGVRSEPSGAYYVLADARRMCDDSVAFARELLQHAKVAVAPGVDFGRNAEGYVRFSYANSLDNIREGVARLREYLGSRG